MLEEVGITDCTVILEVYDIGCFRAECIALLGGDAAKVGACLDAKVTRNAAMQTCMKPTISTIGYAVYFIYSSSFIQ